MGAWNTEILGNDTAMDVYSFFEDLYNKQELDIETIKQNTLEKFGMLTSNGEAVFGADEWLAYALICWECKALDEKTLNVVKEIFTDKEDTKEEWEDLAEKRSKEIEKLLLKLQTPAKRKKVVKKDFIVDVPFQEGDCIIFKDENGIYGGQILLQIVKEQQPDEPNMWQYNLGVTRIFQREKPVMQDFINSYILVINYGETIDGRNALWIKNPELQIRTAYIGSIKSDSEKKNVEDLLAEGEIIGNLTVKRLPQVVKPHGSHWKFFHRYDQFEWEKTHPESVDLSYPIKNYVQYTAYTE